MLFAPGSPELQIYREYARRLGHTVPLPEVFVRTLEALSETYDGFFLDSYGVLNRAEELIPGAAEGVKWLKDHGKKVMVVTNNAALAEEDNVELLRSIGIPLDPGEVVCSGSLLARERKNLGIDGPVFFMGLPSARKYLQDADLESTDNPAETRVVVMASSRGYRMRRIAEAQRILHQPGSLLVVLNPDAIAPRPGGVMARVSGVTARSLARETGCQVALLGKPFGEIYDLALERIGLPRERVVALGDTLATDILGARNAGIDCGLVLTGVTPPQRAEQEIQSWKIWPQWLVPNLQPPRETVVREVD
ncbi:MAG: HAD hydrolase-like protein [Fibrobacteria bacterium]|nr:HAD hydrolase-like protein [Fibrobacteria bacterium]